MNSELKPVKNFYRREIMLDLPPGSNFMYRQCNNMGFLAEPSCTIYTAGFDTEYTSDDVIVVGDEVSNTYLLAGAVTAYRSFTFFTLIKKAANQHKIEVRQPDIMEGETPEEVVILRGNDWKKLLEDYATIVAERNNLPKFGEGKNLTGYCTWYYYYADVTEKDLLENLDAMAKHRSSCYAADVVQIDDGYQTFQGDWNDQDETWPTPLPEIAKPMTDSGMRAGIWLMPFLASTASRVFKEHPDWFVKDENGNPKVSKGWSPPPDDLWVCLDTTIPAVQEHLKNVFQTFRKWGITYFKMDGLGFGLMDGKRSDPNATPLSAFRLGMKAIREAVPDSYLLGCCPPFMACLGYVDGARISNDTRACRSAIDHVTKTNLARWWMFDKFFRCDPDVVIARQDRSTASIGDNRLSIMTGIMTGVSITSDNLNTIAADRLELLGKSAQIRMRDFRPAGHWGAGYWPVAFSGTIDGRKAGAVLNTTNEPVTIKFEDMGLDPEQDAEELLQDLGKRKYVITVMPHDAVLLKQ